MTETTLRWFACATLLFCAPHCASEPDPSPERQRDGDVSSSGRDGEPDAGIAARPLDGGTTLREHRDAAPGDAVGHDGAPARDDADDTADESASEAPDAGVGDAGHAARGADAGSSLRTDAGPPTGSTTVSATIVVAEGDTFDGQGKRYVAGSQLGDGSQSEGQEPIFRLEAGATLRNVVLGAPAADGVHTYGDATLENIVWEDIGEDALTIKQSGTVTLRGGSAEKGSDKVFQINAPSSFLVTDFRARDAGKFIRQNGGTTFRIDVTIERCDISQMDEAIFRTDSATSTVSMSDTRYSQIGEQLFIGVAPGNIREQNNVEY